MKSVLGGGELRNEDHHSPGFLDVLPSRSEAPLRGGDTEVKIESNYARQTGGDAPAERGRQVPTGGAIHKPSWPSTPPPIARRPLSASGVTTQRWI